MTKHELKPLSSNQNHSLPTQNIINGNSNLYESQEHDDDNIMADANNKFLNKHMKIFDQEMINFGGNNDHQ